jgi:hypothetical protein
MALQQEDRVKAHLAAWLAGAVGALCDVPQATHAEVASVLGRWYALRVRALGESPEALKWCSDTTQAIVRQMQADPEPGPKHLAAELIRPFFAPRWPARQSDKFK